MNTIPMTFEEHFATEFKGTIAEFEAMGESAKTLVGFSRRAWEAAIESKKPLAYIRLYKGYDVIGMGDRWTFQDSICNEHFGSREDAIEWAVKNGYRVANL